MVNITKTRQQIMAYHEAGHAVMAYYFGRLLGPMRLYTDVGQLRGEAVIYPGRQGEAYILAAGRACAESFHFPQEKTDYALDYQKLEDLLSKEIPPGSEDHVFESRLKKIVKDTALFFQRPDFRAAAIALAERLVQGGSIASGDDVTAIISSHLNKKDRHGPSTDGL